MGDLTKGSIAWHLATMAGFIAVAMLVQTAYFLVDLYFVSHLGGAAVAGVSAAGNLMFLGMAFGQPIGVGVTSLASRAIGAKDFAAANVTFNQALGMSLGLSALCLAAGYTIGMDWLARVSADAATADQARTYFAAFLPSIALMFPIGAVGSALRAAGVVQGPTAIQAGSLLLNIVLAPVLIAGWGTGVAYGVAGAGWASSIASVAGTLALVAIFPRVQSAMRWQADLLAPRFVEWGRIFGVGLPSAAEFMLMFVVVAVMYWVIRDFGADAQAGFGVGSRVLQSVMMPAMAISFAASPIIGQNLGARQADRVRAAFRAALYLCAAISILLALLMHISPETLTAPFSPNPSVQANADLYLQIISWNLLASAIVFTCSGAFQGLGNTVPSLLSSATRLLTFVAPAIWLDMQGGYQLTHYYWLSVASSAFQAVLSLALVWREMRIKLAGL